MKLEDAVRISGVRRFDVIAGHEENGETRILCKEYTNRPMWFDRTYIKNGESYSLQSEKRFEHQTSIWLVMADLCRVAFLVPKKSWRKMIKEDREFFRRVKEVLAKGGTDYRFAKKA